MLSRSIAGMCFVFLCVALLSGCSTMLGGADGADGASSDIPGITTVPPGYTFPAHDSLTVVTWNVEHFVDEYDNPYIDADREDEPGDEMYRRFSLFLRAVRALDADVLVLQEFESEAFAETLADEQLSDMGYRFFASTESPTWYMNVVLMSRVPLGVVERYADVTTPIEGMRTDDGEPAAQSLTNHRMWRAEVFARPDYAMHVVGAHLKAGPGARNAAWRIGQMRFLHERFDTLLETDPDANILIAGDLNSLADSPELRLLLNTPDRPVPDSIAATGGRATFTDPLHGRPTYTHPSDDPSRQLDYILVNEYAMPEWIRGSARVARPLSADEMALISDHLPVRATFRVR